MERENERKEEMRKAGGGLGISASQTLVTNNPGP
jgi:hypothetical protein